MSKKKSKNISNCKEDSANIILIVMVMVLLFGICGYFMYDLSARNVTENNQNNSIMYYE